METAYICDTGRTRKENQDHVFCSEQNVGMFENLFIVADGMGGHNGGEYASNLAIKHTIEFLKNEKIACEEDIKRALEQSIEFTNQLIYNIALEDINYRGMGTTLVVATIYKERLYVANVGDSRLYTIQSDMRQVTIDHSYVEEMIRMGKITSAEARSHPKKNVITRAVGAENKIEVDIYSINIEDINYLLLCSDGLTNMLTENEILELLTASSNNLNLAVEKMVDDANLKGGYDNISIILAKIC